MRRIIRITADAVLGAAAVVSAAGCYRDAEYYEGAHLYEAQHAYYSDPYPYYDDHRYDRDDHRNARRHYVPSDAERVAEGSGNLMYAPDRAGRVYVRDERTGKVIYRDRIEPGQKVTVDPERRRIDVDGRTKRDELSAKPRERDVFFRADRERRGNDGGNKGGDGGGERRREKSADDGPRERREHRGEPGKGKDKD